MIQRVWKFTIAMCKTWGARVTGGFIIGIIGVWGLTGHTVSPEVGWAIAVGGIVVAAFQVWNVAVNTVEKLKATPPEQEPPKLLVTQKKDPGYHGTERSTLGKFSIFVTVLVSNPTNKANSIIEYEALIMNTDHTWERLKVEEGKRTEGTDEHDQIKIYDFCVIPLNIPALSTVSAVLYFIVTQPARYGQPYKMKITAVDMHGNRFTGDVQF